MVVNRLQSRGLDSKPFCALSLPLLLLLLVFFLDRAQSASPANMWLIFELFLVWLKVIYYWAEAVFRAVVRPPKKNVEGQIVLITGKKLMPRGTKTKASWRWSHETDRTRFSIISVTDRHKGVLKFSYHIKCLTGFPDLCNRQFYNIAIYRSSARVASVVFGGGGKGVGGRNSTSGSFQVYQRVKTSWVYLYKRIGNLS